MSIKDLQEYKEIEHQYKEKLDSFPEVWKYLNIENISSGYKISNHGKIMSLKGKLKSTELRKNYEYVKLYTTDGKRNSYQIHRLVAIMFLEIPNKYLEFGYTYKDLQVNHKNGIRM